MVENVKELEERIRKLGVSDEDIKSYLGFEEHPADSCLPEPHFIVKFKSWMAPSLGSLKIIDLCKQEYAATYEAYPKARLIVPKGQRVEVPATISKAKVGFDEANVLSKGPQPTQTITVKPSQLIYDRYSPRKVNSKRVERMKEAIQSEGIEAVPKPKVTINFGFKDVQPPPTEQNFWIFDGQSTAKAMEELGLKELKVDLYNIGEEEADFLAMRLNQIHGDPLEPIEEARQLKKMMDKYGRSQEQVGKKFQRSQQWVSKHLMLLQMPEEHVTTRVVTSTHAEKIASAPEEARVEVVEKVAKEEIPTRPTAELVKAVKEGAKQILSVPYTGERELCFVCGVHTFFPKLINDKYVCPSCVKKPDLEAKLKVEKPSPPPAKIEAKEYKPKDTWAYRKSLMSDPDSKVNIDVLKELQRRGHKVEYGQKVCLVWTWTDYLVDDKAWFYPDGEKVHEGKEDRDTELRVMLADVTHKRVFGIPYKVHSQKNVKAIADFIEEQVGEG